MGNLENRTSNFDSVSERLDDSIDRLEESIERFRADMNAKFNALIIVMATSGVAIAGSIVMLALRS